jgi:F1F0 ATPase subunit 2
MTEFFPLLMALVGGLALGTFYFGSLWWMVRRIVSMRRPATWLFASFLCRAAMLLAGILLVTGGRWDRVAACMAGLWLARTAIISGLQPAALASRAR